MLVRQTTALSAAVMGFGFFFPLILVQNFSPLRRQIHHFLWGLVTAVALNPRFDPRREKGVTVTESALGLTQQWECRRRQNQPSLFSRP